MLITITVKNQAVIKPVNMRKECGQAVALPNGVEERESLNKKRRGVNSSVKLLTKSEKLGINRTVKNFLRIISIINHRDLAP